MGWTRHAGAVVSLAVLSSVVANYAIHRHFEERIRHRASAVRHEPPKSTEALVFDLPDLPVAAEPILSAVPQTLDQVGRAHLRSGIRPAFQTDEASDGVAVPVPNDGASASERDSGEAREIPAPGADAVRSVIENELSGCSREERDIWFEELKSLPAGVVRDLLQVRKQLRTLPQVARRVEAVHVPPTRRVAEIPVEPTGQVRWLPSPHWTPTVEALEQASAISRHNLANSATPGFKRFRVMLVDAYGPNVSRENNLSDDGRSDRSFVAPMEGAKLAQTILDLEQGTLLTTDRPLDLAIDGEGFFVAMVHDHPVYTRCGAMILDSQRRICLLASETPAVLQPVVTIPADAREIQISSLGQVSVLRKLGADSEPVGQLQLARFASEVRLRPMGGTLLVSTAGSGAAEVGLPDAGGRGSIQQGCLEQSNADPEAEASDLNQWQALLKSLPSVSHPVTARGDEPASR